LVRRRTSRQILIGALVMIFILSACNRLALASPTPVWTVTPAGQPLSPTVALSTATPMASSLTPAIPITGENVVYLQCQFCVDAETQAVVIFPDSATFDVSPDTAVSCLTADVIDGRRILICHGTPSTTFYLNICSDPSNCSLFSLTLQPCPLIQSDATPLASGTPSVPMKLTPVKTVKPNKKPTLPTDTALPAGTPTPGASPATPTTAVNTPVTPLPTSYSASLFVNVGR
jgi:hypothetical protein